MKFAIHTLVGESRYSDTHLSTNIKKCIEETHYLNSINFHSRNGRFHAKSIQVGGHIELYLNPVIFKLESRDLLYTWTFLVIGIEEILQNKKAKSPLLDPGFFMIPNKERGVTLGYDWSDNYYKKYYPEEIIDDDAESEVIALETVLGNSSSNDDFTCTIEISNKFTFAQDILLAAREAVTFYELLYSWDTVFQTSNSRELIDLFKQHTDSLDATLSRTYPAETPSQ